MKNSDQQLTAHNFTKEHHLLISPLASLPPSSEVIISLNLGFNFLSFHYICLYLYMVLTNLPMTGPSKKRQCLCGTLGKMEEIWGDFSCTVRNHGNKNI